MTVYGNVFVDVMQGLSLGNGASGPNRVHNNTFVQIRGTRRIGGQVASLYNNIIDVNNIQAPASSGQNIFLDTTNPADVFVDPQGEDFRLKQGSPAIGAGTWESWMDAEWRRDLLGTEIRQEGGLDIGGLQYRPLGQ
jgi:hypothetical protein